MSLSAEERSMRASLAANARWSKHDRSEGTRRARQAFESRFIDEVDPDRVLPEAERLKRAESARKAHFKRMALASAKSRRERRQPPSSA